MTELTCERRVACQLPRSELWPRLTDTDALNRRAGLRALRVQPLHGVTAARYLASTRLGGFAVTWEEEPYEWRVEEAFAVRRRMRSGPLRSLHMHYQLAVRGDGGTDVLLRLVLWPRLALLRPIIWLSATQSLAELGRAIARLDAEAAGRRQPPPPRLDEARLRQANQTLAGHSAGELLARLAALLRHGDDATVGRLRPFVLAAAWSAAPEAVLRLCLEAVRAHLLVPQWDIICPSCRGPSLRVPALSALPPAGTCQLCELRFALDAGAVIELSFAPLPAVRAVSQAIYCLGGPARTPHVLAQAVLAPGAACNLPVPGAAGVYRLFVRGGRSVPLTVQRGGAALVRISTLDVGYARLPALAPGATLEVQHQGDGALHVKIERQAWEHQAVTPRHLEGLPAALRAAVGA